MRHRGPGPQLTPAPPGLPSTRLAPPTASPRGPSARSGNGERPRHAVVVDGYHIAGDERGLAPAFRARGVVPVTVLSTPGPLPKFATRWFPEHYDAVHCFDGDLDGLVATVAAYDPLCIVPGNEHGIELAAALGEALLPGQGNAPGSARGHRDKGAMVAALERAGVPALRTICTDDPAAVAAWIADHGLAGAPLVVKPPMSGGTDNVHLVEAGDGWRSRFDEVLGATNGYGEVNDRVVVQEQAVGTEYIVDLYSVDGRHGLVDACVYGKHARGSRLGIYDTVDFLPPDHPELAVLADYAMRAADAVGIRNGPTHAEVMLTADGPRLIELAARHSGSCMMLAAHLATGDNQVERTVRHRLDGAFTPGFELRDHVRTVWLAAESSGVVRHVDLLEAAQDLPTVQRMAVPPDGTHVPATYDKATALGWIIQVAADRAAIEADYRQIRALEREWTARQAGDLAAAPAERGRIPHLLVVGARAEALGRLVGLPVALTVVRRPGGIGAFEDLVGLRTVEADVTDVDALVTLAREVHAGRPVDAVVGLTERSLHASSLVGEALGVRVNPSSAVALAQDKAAMRRRLAEQGLDTTAHRLCRSFEDALAFAGSCPGGLVLKPVDGNGGTGVVLVADPSDRSALAEAWAWTASASGGWVTPGAAGNTVLAEERLVGRELSVETVSGAGRHQVLAVTAKHTAGPPHFVELGHDLPAPLTPAEHAATAGAACDALSAIGHLWGPAHTEVMLTGNGTAARVVEINPRWGGDRIWEMVELATGVSLPVATVMTFAHGELRADPADRREPAGGAAVRFLTAPAGRITAVTGLDEARAVDGVLRVGEVGEVGRVVPPLSDSWGRVGYVLAVGPDVGSATRAAEQAVARVLVHTAAHTAPDDPAGP